MTVINIEEQVESIHLKDRRRRLLRGRWPAGAKVLALNFISIRSANQFDGAILLGRSPGRPAGAVFENRLSVIGEVVLGLHFPLYVTRSMWPLKILARCKRGTKVDMQVDLQFYYEKGAK
jgi:hypothetical protein